MRMNAFVVDNTSFDQNGFLPVKLLIWFTGLDKFCGICTPVAVSMVRLTSSSCLEGSPQIESRRYDVSTIP